MNIASFIDHTILKADSTFEEVERVCKEALEHQFYSVCVNSFFIPFVKEQLKGSDVKITSVVGFPLGAMSTNSKVFETTNAIQAGADEIDMVINLSLLKSKQYDLFLHDIRSVKNACGDHVLKVILETCLLTKEEIQKACELCVEAKADFVKTSTGFSKGGATVEDVALMKSVVGNMGVKASGGVRDYETAIKMIEAGATRIGASSSVAIVQKQSVQSGGY